MSKRWNRRLLRQQEKNRVPPLYERIPHRPGVGPLDLPVVIADNVAEFFYAVSDQEHWKLTEDFPNLAPPFRHFLVYFRKPSRVYSRETGIGPWPGPPEVVVEVRGFDLTKDPLLQDGMEKYLASLRDPSNAALRARRGERILAEHPEYTQMLKEILDRGPEQGMAAVRTAPRELAELFSLAMGEWAAGYKGELPTAAGTRDLFLSEGVRWIVSMDVWWPPFGPFRISQVPRHLMGDVVHVRPSGMVAVDVAGNPRVQMGATADLLAAVGPDEVMHTAQALVPMCDVARLTVCLMNCKNVTMRPVGEAKEEGKSPPLEGHGGLRVYELLIDPMVAKLRSEGNVGEVGLQKALHICRGHFKDYRESGLFGQHRGVYWWADQVRGSAESGRVEKSYRVES